MAATLDEPTHSDLLHALAHLPRNHAQLVGPDGAVDLPEPVYHVLRKIVEDLANGRALVAHTVDPQLTTGQAADLLGVTRVTLVKMLEDGEIPHTRVGRHRRVQLADVVAYKKRVRRERETAIDAAVFESAQDGTADVPRILPADDE